MKNIDVGQTIPILAVVGVLVGFISPEASSQEAEDEVGIVDVVEEAEDDWRVRARAERIARLTAEREARERMKSTQDYVYASIHGRRVRQCMREVQYPDELICQQRADLLLQRGGDGYISAEPHRSTHIREVEEQLRD